MGVIADGLWPGRCAAAVSDSARPASPLPRHRRPARSPPRRPCRISRPSAASPIVPVTTMRSPGLAPLRRTIPPAGTRPNAVIEIISGPGVETVSPPSSGQPNRATSSPSPRANDASQASSAERSASVSTNPAGVAPFAARSLRLTRSALRARVSGGSPEQKMHALDDGVRRDHDVVAARLQDRRIVAETESAGIGRERTEIARDQRVLAGGHFVVMRSRLSSPAPRPTRVDVCLRMMTLSA